MDTEEKVLRCARAAHNTMVTYCQMHDDYTIKEWDDAEQWQRDSTISMVKSILEGNYTARGAHEHWLKGKLDKGYVYGAVKNDDPAKGQLTNPNIIPYEQIPVVQRMKDHLHIVVTIGIAAHYGLKIARVPELV